MVKSFVKFLTHELRKLLHKHLQRHVVDFYISDFQSGLRALVKTGYGARVTPYVEESVVLEVDQSSIDSSPQFLTWLNDRNISRDDRVMRLKEGYITQQKYKLSPIFKSLIYGFNK